MTGAMTCTKALTCLAAALTEAVNGTSQKLCAYVDADGSWSCVKRRVTPVAIAARDSLHTIAAGLCR